MSEGFFVCLWCAAVSDDPAVYRHPLSACGGSDAETGEPLCDGCVEAAAHAQAGEEGGGDENLYH